MKILCIRRRRLSSRTYGISRIATMAAVGIDLGTTYSCVAAHRNGKIEVIANDMGSRLTPSFVAFVNEQRLIGRAAKAQQSMNTANTLHQIKRIIGRKYDENVVQSDVKQWGFKVVNDENIPKLEVQYKGSKRLLCPEEVSAMVLTNLKETAEAFLGGKVEKAVITVPAYFNDAQRKATRAAGSIAGLKVIGMINEPTAAAIAYGLENVTSKQKTILIFDLGGGTFDVTIIKIQDKKFEVLATGGDSHLGGEDFTDAMFKHFASEFNEENNVDISDKPRSVARLRNECERVKITLSVSTVENLQVDALYGGIDFSSSVSRSTFEFLNEDLFQKTIDTAKNTMKEAGLSTKQIDDVVVVGGSTRIPRIQELLENYFDGKKMLKTVNADEAIAYGAAVRAAILSDDLSNLVRNVELQDVASLSLGVAVRSNVMSVIIPRNSKIPIKCVDSFNTVSDNQTAVSIKLFEGERASTDDNRHLGTFEVKDLPPRPAGEVAISICFDIDKAGILTVTASDKITGKTNHIVIEQDRGSLSQEEIKSLVADAEQFKKQDEKFREKSDLIHELETFIQKSIKSIRQDGAKLKKELETEKDKVLAECTKLLTWLKQNRKSAGIGMLQHKKKEIESKCLPFLAKLYLLQK